MERVKITNVKIIYFMYSKFAFTIFAYNFDFTKFIFVFPLK